MFERFLIPNVLALAPDVSPHLTSTKPGMYLSTVSKPQTSAIATRDSGSNTSVAHGWTGWKLSQWGETVGKHMYIHINCKLQGS